MEAQQRILKAFKEMARFQGIHAVRIDDLAKNAGLSKRTIYLHFKGKEDLVENAFDSLLSDIRMEVDQIANQPNLLEYYTVIIDTILKESSFLINIQSLKDLQIYYPDLWSKWEKFRTDLISSVVKAIVNETKKKWVLEIDPRLIREAILAIDRRFTTPEFALEMGMSMEEVVLSYAKLVINSYL
jgi:AcrR family transcriptional regulator